MKAIFLAASVFLLSMLPAYAAPKVVASTAWVAAMARAAGGTEVSVIAPPSLAHPPDYDPRPADLLAVSRADLLLVGGYEAFVPRMREAANSQAKTLVVNTSYAPQIVRHELLAIATQLGSQAQARAYIKAYETTWHESTRRLQRRFRHHPPVVVVQKFMLPWAQLLGITPAASFGPGPLTPDELRRIKALRPSLIIDSAHAAPALTLAEITGARRVVLRNFPHGGEGLLDVLKSNVDSLFTGVGP